MSVEDAIPDVAEEIIGFRSWLVDASSLLQPPRLLSYNSGTVWPFDDWLQAECRYEGEVPHEVDEDTRYAENHHCGIYAARDRSSLMYTWRYHVAEACIWTQGSTQEVLAIGEVGLAGRFIPGTRAYRAARGRPLRLWLPHLHWRLATPLSRAYDIPVEVTNPYKRGKSGNRTRR